jgi:hypothetical protein
LSDPDCEGKNDRCLTTIDSEPASSKRTPSVGSNTSYYKPGATWPATGAGVAFKYKDYRVDGHARQKVMFIRRFLIHGRPKKYGPTADREHSLATLIPTARQQTPATFKSP